MQVIYNKQGRAVGWLSGKDIYSTGGYFIGYLIDNAVYNHKSQYCGTLKQSFFRDIGGHVVAFLKDAKKGPALPSLKALPSKPAKKPRPSTNVAPPAPAPKPPKYGWSKLNWEAFIK